MFLMCEQVLTLRMIGCVVGCFECARFVWQQLGKSGCDTSNGGVCSDLRSSDERQFSKQGIVGLRFLKSETALCIL